MIRLRSDATNYNYYEQLFLAKKKKLFKQLHYEILLVTCVYSPETIPHAQIYDY